MEHIILNLTEEQKAKIAPVMLKALMASEDGKPGMVLAQITGDNMVVGFLPHDRAINLSVKNDGRPKTIRTILST